MGINDEEIIEFYLKDKMTAQEIADKLGYKTGTTILNRLHKLGITIRDRYECQRPLFIDESTLRYLYETKQTSIDNIGLMFGCSDGPIKRLLEKYKIEIRDKTYKIRDLKITDLPLDKLKLTCCRISESRKEGFANGNIVHWNKGRHWDIETRNQISKTLLDGRDPAPSNYGKDWKMQRTTRLQIDNFMCQQCATTEKLEVHHWEPYRFSYDNGLDNLVTLCETCHREIHETYKKEGFIKELEGVEYGEY
jgi:5-methylcytosine-specific restriction endonuclease McrA